MSHVLRSSPACQWGAWNPLVCCSGLGPAGSPAQVDSIELTPAVPHPPNLAELARLLYAPVSSEAGHGAQTPPSHPPLPRSGSYTSQVWTDYGGVYGAERWEWGWIHIHLYLSPDPISLVSPCSAPLSPPPTDLAGEGQPQPAPTLCPQSLPLCPLRGPPPTWANPPLEPRMLRARRI